MVLDHELQISTAYVHRWDWDGLFREEMIYFSRESRKVMPKPTEIIATVTHCKTGLARPYTVVR